jgi:hypothetical protein
MEKSKAPIHKHTSVSKGLYLPYKRPVNHSLGFLELAINLLHSHVPRLFSEGEDLCDFGVKGSVAMVKSQLSGVCSWTNLAHWRRGSGFYHRPKSTSASDS